MDRVYIAGPIFNKEQLSVVRSLTIAAALLEYKYFSPYENSQGIWKGRAPKDCSPEERAAVLRGNIENLAWADLLVAWVGGTEDGRTDTGVVWEMGHFNALQRYHFDGTGDPPKFKFTLAYIHPGDKRQSMNLMLAGTVDALAYGPAQLHTALALLRKANGLSIFRQDVERKFPPDRHILHETEPVG